MKERDPLYAIAIASKHDEKDTFWLHKVENRGLVFTQVDDVHWAKQFGPEVVDGLNEASELLEFMTTVQLLNYGPENGTTEITHCQHFSGNLKVIDLNNDILQGFEIKRLRWLRGLAALEREKINWHWSDKEIEDLVPHPRTHFHIKIPAENKKYDFVEYWPTTNKWRTNKDTAQARHGLGNLLRFLGK